MYILHSAIRFVASLQSGIHLLHDFPCMSLILVNCQTQGMVSTVTVWVRTEHTLTTVGESGKRRRKSSSNDRKRSSRTSSGSHVYNKIIGTFDLEIQMAVLVHAMVLGGYPLIFIFFAIKLATERTNTHTTSNDGLGRLGAVQLQRRSVWVLFTVQDVSRDGFK